jgi:hypothetical protein
MPYALLTPEGIFSQSMLLSVVSLVLLILKTPYETIVPPDGKFISSQVATQNPFLGES